MYYEVGVVRQGIDFLCTYHTYDELQIGQFVSVNFNHKEAVGIIFNKQPDSSYTGDIKTITITLPYSLHSTYLNFTKIVSSYNLTPIGSVLKLLCPFTLNTLSKTSKCSNNVDSVFDNVTVALNNEQQVAVDAIMLGKFKTYLLHGVTGSGKTEVFLEVVRRIGERQILILVPEIALSNAMAKNIAQRCGREVFIWHNSVTTANKLNIWRRAISGEPIVVVGARSALFIPFADLKLIVVDEEHDPSFKQNEHQIYHARDMAVYLASLQNIPIILSSATPSIESYKNAIEGKYEYLKLISRYYTNAELPNIKINDMRSARRDEVFNSTTIERIRHYLQNKQQVLIFINRRGYATKRLCTKCGWKAICPACDAWLCYHSTGSKLVCHYCGYTCDNIRKCKKCGNEYLVNFGIGIEKVYSECKKLFSNYNIVQCSSDTMNTPTKIDATIQNIIGHKVDIIIGTQILAKGHNFTALNLVVIVSLDYMLYTGNFRSIENTFQLLAQVTGRAGRMGDFDAEVLIQTYNPDEPLLQLISNPDEFYKRELNNRKMTGMPPYRHMVNIEILSSDEKKSFDFSNVLAQKLQCIKNCTVLGVLVPGLHKINYKYKYHVVLVSSQNLQKNVQKIVSNIKRPYKVNIKIDIDPYNFD